METVKPRMDAISFLNFDDNQMLKTDEMIHHAQNVVLSGHLYEIEGDISSIMAAGVPLDQICLKGPEYIVTHDKMYVRTSISFIEKETTCQV